jgi:DNA polymerase-4
MDAFYASVEQRDHPEWRGKPLVVGGSPDSRSVVCTASYEARKFGIRSAIPCSQALRLCPTAIFVPPRFEAYKEASRHLHRIFSDYTETIEPLSLDEAFLDVTDNASNGGLATPIAKEIRQRIRQELSLTGSAGVSYCKFLAKVASDMRKPDGLTVIPPEKAQDIIDALPVGRFFSVGPVTEKRLLEAGWKTGRDLRLAGGDRLGSLLGRQGLFLYDLSRGIDERRVESRRESKSVGAEDTFQRDTTDIAWMRGFLATLSEKVADRLASKSLEGRTVTLKVKFHDFRQVTRSRTLDEPVSNGEAILETALDLLCETEAGRIPVRLLGIQLSQFGEPEIPEEPQRWVQLELPLPVRKN